MKALFTLILAGLFVTNANARTLSPAGTYTFVDPCTPFALLAPIPNTYGCFSFSATNAGASDPNGFYSWNFGDGRTAVGSSINHCYDPVTAPTVYTVNVTYNSSALCSPFPVTRNYTVQLLPPAQGTCIQNSPSYSLAALSVTIWAGMVIGTHAFQFDYGDGTTPGPFNQTTYSVCGNYIVQVKNWELSNPNNVCYAYTAVNIACPAPVPTGVEKHAGDEIPARLYPNPSPGMVTVSAAKSINGIIIVDLTGREWLVKEKVDATHTRVDLSALPPGVYFMNCHFHDGSTSNTKLVKE